MKNIEKHHFEEFQVVAVVKDRGLHIHVYTTMEKMSGIYSLFIKSSQFYILEWLIREVHIILHHKEQKTDTASD